MFSFPVMASIVSALFAAAAVDDLMDGMINDVWAVLVAITGAIYWRGVSNSTSLEYYIVFALLSGMAMFVGGLVLTVAEMWGPADALLFGAAGMATGQYSLIFLASFLLFLLLAATVYHHAGQKTLRIGPVFLFAFVSTALMVIV